MEEHEIEERERALRMWFTRNATGERATVDGLDIGWGGVQRWATSRMPDLGAGRHLDFACGYGTFLAELGWRFPNARLVGLNIDFEGAHALARPLLAEAGVEAELVQGDAREMPFPDASFDSVSCFWASGTSRSRSVSPACGGRCGNPSGWFGARARSASSTSTRRGDSSKRCAVPASASEIARSANSM